MPGGGGGGAGWVGYAGGGRVYTRGVRGMVRGVRKTCALFRVIVCFI